MRKINKLIDHCSATREVQPISVDTIRDWHVNGRGWNDIGYHFYIDLDGNIFKGRNIETMGAHCKGQNRNSIGVCYCGGVEKDGKTPKDTRNEKQKESLLAVLRTLKAMFPDSAIHSHRDFAKKACPSFDATSEYSDLNVVSSVL